MREIILENSTRGKSTYQIDYGVICIATDCQTTSAFLSQMKVLFITTQIHSQMQFVAMCLFIT